jgi:hypothetical protein
MKCRGDSYSVILKPSPAKSSPKAFSLGMTGVWHTWQLIWYLRANAGMADICLYGSSIMIVTVSMAALVMKEVFI